MAASVRIEDEAFTDTRIEVLGTLLGTSKYDALGRLAHLWRQATQMGKDILPEALIAHHLDVTQLIACGLGVKTRNGVRLKGARGRIDWLERKRAAGRLNGHKGKDFGRLGGRPPKTPTKPGEGVLENPPPAPAPAPALKDTNGDFGFDAFWLVWPKKVAKPAALRAWTKLSPGRELFDLIVADVSRRKALADWVKEDGQYIPHPATYLNGRRWEDDQGQSMAGQPAHPSADPLAAEKAATRKMQEEHAAKRKQILEEQRAKEGYS